MLILTRGVSHLLLIEVMYALLLLLWVIFLVNFVTKRLYHHYVSKEVEKTVIIYYNRKIIHILGGGISALLVPFIFTNALIPFSVAILLTIMSYLPYRTGRINYWYQVPNNRFDVHFCFTWGFLILLGKIIFNDWWIGVVPILFMSIGDAVTGIVRNYIFRRRCKSWWGNLTMLAICIPLGLPLGLKGILAAVIASLIEHYEYKWIDDNITVPFVSFLLLSAL